MSFAYLCTNIKYIKKLKWRSRKKPSRVTYLFRIIKIEQSPIIMGKANKCSIDKIEQC